jgi:hypothetical protein
MVKDEAFKSASIFSFAIQEVEVAVACIFSFAREQIELTIATT